MPPRSAGLYFEPAQTSIYHVRSTMFLPQKKKNVLDVIIPHGIPLITILAEGVFQATITIWWLIIFLSPQPPFALAWKGYPWDRLQTTLHSHVGKIRVHSSSPTPIRKILVISTPFMEHFYRDTFIIVPPPNATVELKFVRPMVLKRTSYYDCFPLTVVTTCALPSLGSVRMQCWQPWNLSG